MKYKRYRGSPFTLGIFVLMLSAYIKESGKLPEKILLPPEEYCYLTFYRMIDNDFRTTIPWDDFNGIPLEVDTSEQEHHFYT